MRAAHQGSLSIAVRDGIVSISGRVECKSAISGLIRGIRLVEGVVGVDANIAYDIDDSYPITPVSF